MPVITKSRFLELYGAIWNRVRQQVPRQGCHLIDHVLKLTCSYAQYRHSFAGKRTFSSHSKLTFRRAPHNIVSASSQTTQRHRKASLQLNCLWLKALRLPGPSQWCSFPAARACPQSCSSSLTKGILGYIDQTVKPNSTNQEKRQSDGPSILGKCRHGPKKAGKNAVLVGTLAFRHGMLCEESWPADLRLGPPISSSRAWSR